MAKQNIARAICTEKWDGTRAAPSGFYAGWGVSVSRLAVIPLAEHWDMLPNVVRKPARAPTGSRIGEINVGRLQQIHDYPRRSELTVESKPEDWNPAHAEIPQRITRGLANKIVDALKLHQPPR